jgi:two-component system NtrC family sensor kinase
MNVSFRARVLLVLVLVGVVPTALMGFLLYRASFDELSRNAARLETQTAETIAALAHDEVFRAVEGLQQSAGSLPLSTLSPQELSLVLRIPYRQVRGLDAVVLLDAKGQAVVPPVFETGANGEPLPGHGSFSEEAQGAFSRAVPLSQALELGAAVGPAYQVKGGPPHVAIAVRAGDRVVAAALSLFELEAQLGGRGEGERIIALDAKGAALAGEPGTASSWLAAAQASGAPRVEWVGSELVAFAPVKELGWGVAVALPRAIALRGADRVLEYTIYWSLIGLLLTAVLGFFVSRGLSKPIAALSETARALNEGRYHERVKVQTRDELGLFAQAFNQMAEGIQKRDDEIHRFNEELQARVEQRTEELKAAQDQIARTRRLAAFGSLGAGIAHELNNPMTAILGLVSIVRDELGGKAPQRETLETVLDEARRMTRIIANVRAMADAEREAAGVPFSLGDAVRAAVDLVRPRAREKSIEPQMEIHDGAPDMQGDPHEVKAMIVHLLENAVTASPPGGEVRVSLSVLDRDALKLQVRDAGKGIAPEIRERIFDPFFTTKDEPQAVGMGLTLAHQIVERHQGKIMVDSEVGKGSTFTVLLPCAGAAAHLY